MLLQFFIFLFILRTFTFSLKKDLLSSPQYTLTFESPSIDEQTAFTKLTQPNHHLLRSNGTKYLCEVPPPRNAVQSHQLTLLSPSETEDEISRLSPIAEGLLSPISKECFYHTSGWWTYAYCPGQYFKQFHGIPGTIPPQPDQRYDEYVMGRGLNRTVQNIEGVWNYVDRLENGDFCGVISKARATEVMIFCNPVSKLSLIKEISTCVYQASFGTPLLCDEEAFQPPSPEESINISCRKITSFPEIDEKSESASQMAKQLIFKMPETEEINEPTKETKETEEEELVELDMIDDDKKKYASVQMLLGEDGTLEAVSGDEDELSEEEKEQLEKLKKKLEKQLKALFDGNMREI